MSASELAALLLFATAMTFSPGPNTTLSTALAANLGLKRAMRFCLAVPTGWCILMLTCGLGLGTLVMEVPVLRWGIQVVGVGYLAWLALRLLRQTALATSDERSLQVSFVQGVALQFVNIKAWMLALTITAGWVVNAGGEPAANTRERLAIVVGVMMFYAFTSNFTYALAGSLLRGWLSQGRRLAWFNRSLAGVLGLTGAWMLTV